MYSCYFIGADRPEAQGCICYVTAGTIGRCCPEEDPSHSVRLKRNDVGQKRPRFPVWVVNNRNDYTGGVS
jgi:hypothetical protein